MRTAWGVAALLGLLGACSTDSGMSISALGSVSPAANTSGVARNASITMDAGMVMDTATCRDRMLLHIGDSTGPVVPARVTWENGNRRMMLQPETPLAPLTTYFVHVRDSMMTPDPVMGGGMMGGGMMGPSGGGHRMMMQPPAGGMRMSDGMGWTFTTGS